MPHADQGWLARRHALVAFPADIRLQADRADDARIRALEPRVERTPDTVP